MACTQYGRRPRLVQVVRKGQRPQTCLLRGGLAYVIVRFLRSPLTARDIVPRSGNLAQDTEKLGHLQPPRLMPGVEISAGHRLDAANESDQYRDEVVEAARACLDEKAAKKGVAARGGVFAQLRGR